MPPPDPDVSAFLDVVTHDLRAPIASVRTMISLLSQGHVGELQASQAELVRRIDARLALLQAQVEDLTEIVWLQADQGTVLRFVRAAVERGGGTVVIEGTEGEGTTVTVCLPGRRRSP
jgi:signal transduction histidine kinase